jgi:glutamyl-tRNA(Gln) amidotransferase subunit E
VKGIRLPGYQGLLKREHTRLGKDLATYAKLVCGIDGIIHSDEMPGYGFRESEIQELKKYLQLRAEDAFILALGAETMVNAALQAVLQRAAMFFDGVSEEVRRSLPDYTTEYMRPLPGAARMYPETDVPPIRVTKERLQRIHLPEKTEVKRKRFNTQYGLNEEQITQLLSSGYDDDFERLIESFLHMKNVIIRTYLNTFAELENEGFSTEAIDDQILCQLFSALSEGRFAKEAIPKILKDILQHPTSSLDEVIHRCGLQSENQEEIIKVVRTIVAQRQDFIKKRGADALGPLMGLVMKELRGKADGKLLSKILQEEIQKVMT